MDTTQIELTESELDQLISHQDRFCRDLERLEELYKNPRSVTQSKYPKPYQLLAKLQDARVMLRTKP